MTPEFVEMLGQEFLRVADEYRAARDDYRAKGAALVECDTTIRRLMAELYAEVSGGQDLARPFRSVTS